MFPVCNTVWSASCCVCPTVWDSCYHCPIFISGKMYIGAILINFLAWASNLLDTSWSKTFFHLSLIFSIFSTLASLSATCHRRTTCWSRSDNIIFQLTNYIYLLIGIHMCTSITFANYIKHSIKCNIMLELEKYHSIWINAWAQQILLIALCLFREVVNIPHVNNSTH